MDPTAYECPPSQTRRGADSGTTCDATNAGSTSSSMALACAGTSGGGKWRLRGGDAQRGRVASTSAGHRRQPATAADRSRFTAGAVGCLAPLPLRPLLGIRVLDLTRIIAGPVATRFLAGLGADVLRIDPVDWQEPTLEEEITLGKRCARLNIKTQTDKQRLITLISQADVIVHGYRADALDALGLDCHTRAALSPGIVDVSLNARDGGAMEKPTRFRQSGANGLWYRSCRSTLARRG